MYTNLFISFLTFQSATNSGSSETVLYSGQIPAGNLVTDNLLHFFSGGHSLGGLVKVYLGNNGNNTDTNVLTINPYEDWHIEGDIVVSGTTNLVCSFSSPDTGVALNTILSNVVLTAPVYITITGTAASSNEITILSAAAWSTITNNNPYSPCNSCDIFTPPVNSNPVTCADISCANYAPSCFTPTNSNLCGYIQGIDNSICNINAAITNLQSEITGVGNLSCANIIMSPVTNPYPCIPGTSGSMNLCNWALDVNKLFCTINTTLASLESTNGTGQNNLVTDGTNGTMTSVTGLVASTNSTVSLSNAVVHGTSSNSVKWLSSATATHTLSTSTAIAVTQGNSYLARVFINGSSSYPSGATVSLSINGTGTQTQTSALTLSSGNSWVIDPVIYVPDANQNITITITVTGFTSGDYIYVADLIFVPLSSSNATGNFPFNLAQINDVGEAIQAISNPFVLSGGSVSYSSSSLSATIPQSSYVVNGKVEYVPSTTITLQSGASNYVYYDTWTDGYVVKTSSVADATQIVIAELVTNTSGTTSYTDLRVTTPFTGTQIASGTITGTQIAANTITAGNIANSGVTAGTYGSATQVGQYVVNAAGLITSSSNVNITFPVTSVNSLTGAVSLGLGNLNNVTLTSVATGNILQYNGSAWVNAALSSAGVPTFSGSPLNNYLTYWTSANNISGANTLQRGNIYSSDLGISINTGSAPTESLDVAADYNGFARFKLNNTYNTIGNSAKSGISFLMGGISYLDMYSISPNFNPSGIYKNGNAVVENTNGGIVINAGSSGAPSSVVIAIGQTPAVIVGEGRNVSIGSTPPMSSAALDIQSTAGALIVPRLTQAEINSLSPSIGMVVFNRDTGKFNFYTGSSTSLGWVAPF